MLKKRCHSRPVPGRPVPARETRFFLAQYFHATRYCALNPHFGLASALVAGADADLVVYDTLIDNENNANDEYRRCMTAHAANKPIEKLCLLVLMGR